MTKKYYIFYPRYDVFSKRCDIYDTVRAVLWDVIVTSEDGWLDFCWWCGAVERMGSDWRRRLFGCGCARTCRAVGDADGAAMGEAEGADGRASFRVE